jgi:DNA-binding transcriptional LysR family regulator
MDLRQLRYVVAVADAGGIRKASRQLDLAQPSLSQALRQLEAELGVELIRRSTRGIELTEAGDEFLNYARDILDRAAEAHAAMRRRAEQRSCTLRVGLLAGIIAAGELTGPILERFRQARPDVEIQVQDISFSDQAAPLLDGQVDVAIGRAPIANRLVDTVPLAHDPRVLLVGATHELAGAERVDVEEILDERTVPVIAPKEFAAHWHLDDLRGGSHVDPAMPAAKTVADLQFAVATGRAIMIAASVTARVLPNGLVRAVQVDRLPPSLIEVARPYSDRRRVIRDFVEAAAQAARENIGLMPGATLAN